MIISRTPFRVSFFGGGTDYPIWYREHGGAVLAATIDKYCYITCRCLPPFFAYRSRIVYSKVETVAANHQIKHRAVRGILGYLNIEEGVEIHHDGDLPGRSGLGSSSSFTVGLLHALFALKRTMLTKDRLAKTAIHVEQSVLRENVGDQDQVLASYGGFVRIEFRPNAEEGDFQVAPVILPSERRRVFQDHLLLFYTGISRTASEVVQEQLMRTEENRPSLHLIRQMVDEALTLITGNGPLEDFGKLLHESWLLKKGLSSRISTSQIDEIYDEARRAGAIGGKLLGAGGGGFILLFAKPGDHLRIKQRLKSLLHVPFRLESHGSQILHYDPDVDGHEAQARENPPAEMAEVRGDL
ncbi:MAG: kinase [Candidatus Omnitrophica bacterium]|nr:kinase [Candidatus Omnitrophota bacterium]